jgi:condensin complex subunit 1
MPLTAADVLSQILAEHSAKGLEDAALEADVAKKTKQAKKRAAARAKPAAAPARRGGRRKAVVESDEDED